MTNVTRTNQRTPRPALREDQASYRARSAEALEGTRPPRAVAADLRRLVRGRAGALIELEKN
ncbi:MAG: hypothetical protein IT299_04775 [Dehalococcoidia bacterium]|nr:hypothetical protein [Dehalococcoidia bacterium]